MDTGTPVLPVTWRPAKQLGLMAAFQNWGDYRWPGQNDTCEGTQLGICADTGLETAEHRHELRRESQLTRGEALLLQAFELDHPRATELVRPDPGLLERRPVVSC